jgi:Kef-type K+ transport system membrane component KefB
VLSLKAVGFLVVAILAGIRLAPLLIRWVGRMKVRGTLIVTVFFATIEMKVRPAMLKPCAHNAPFGIALLLTIVAVVSKLVAGIAVYQPGRRRWPVGVGMVPRGEVGLIFAGTGLAAGGIAESSTPRWWSW